MNVGILALQGDVREHAAALGALGVATTPVRRPDDLEGLDGIILPGGESTTLSMLLTSSGLFEPLAAALGRGLPAFGTCAGLVLLAAEVLDGRPDQRSFGVLNCAVRRNGYGRQAQSFETQLAADRVAVALGEDPSPLPAVFIRAPVVVSVGAPLEVLASIDGTGGTTPVVVRQGPVMASAFHPELTADRRLHRLFTSMIERAVPGVPDPAPSGSRQVDW